MRAHGNGTPQVCIGNLLRIVRGEVPYERIKGLDARLVDRPISVASLEVQADAERMLTIYEPRVDIKGVKLAPDDASGGSFIVTADVQEKE